MILVKSVLPPSYSCYSVDEHGKMCLPPSSASSRPAGAWQRCPAPSEKPAGSPGHRGGCEQALCGSVKKTLNQSDIEKLDLTLAAMRLIRGKVLSVGEGSVERRNMARREEGRKIEERISF